MLRTNFGFINKYYKPEWEQNEGFEDGSAYKSGDGSWTIYDGSQNFMGRIKPDGTFISNGPGEPSEYEMTFLRSALEEIQAHGGCKTGE